LPCLLTLAQSNATIKFRIIVIYHFALQVAAHFDGGAAAHAPPGGVGGPPGGASGGRDRIADSPVSPPETPADNDDAQQPEQSPAAPSVDSILDQARSNSDRKKTAQPGSISAGRRLGDSSNSSGASGGSPLTRRNIDVVFFRDGVAFLEKSDAGGGGGGGGQRKKGMHTFSSRPELPVELDGLDDRVVLSRLAEGDATYAATIKLLNDGRVPPGRPQRQRQCPLRSSARRFN
jgi:hypothetical protein